MCGVYRSVSSMEKGLQFSLLCCWEGLFVCVFFCWLWFSGFRKNAGRRRGEVPGPSFISRTFATVMPISRQCIVYIHSRDRLLINKKITDNENYIKEKGSPHLNPYFSHHLHGSLNKAYFNVAKCISSLMQCNEKQYNCSEKISSLRGVKKYKSCL